MGGHLIQSLNVRSIISCFKMILTLTHFEKGKTLATLTIEI